MKTCSYNVDSKFFKPWPPGLILIPEEGFKVKYIGQKLFSSSQKTKTLSLMVKKIVCNHSKIV